MEGGIDVHEEQSSVAALRLLEERRFDVIVSDYQMPEMDGLRLLRELRGRGGTTPFIIFTGRGREVVAIEALNNGADFYLQKGGNPNVQFGELRNAVVQLHRREQARRQFRQSEEKYRLLVEGASSIIMKINPQGTITYMNPFGLRFFGLEADHIIGSSIVGTIFEPDVGQRFVRFLAMVRERTGRELSNIHASRGPRGSTAWISWTARPMLERDGALSEVLCIGNDVTPTKRAEEEIQKSYSLIRATLESIDEGIVVISSQGQVEHFNDNFVRMLGLSKAALRGGSRETIIQHILHRIRDPRSFQSILEDVRRSPLESTFDVIEFLDGRVLEMTSSPQKAEGDVMGRVWTFRYAPGSKREADIPFRYNHPSSEHR